MSRFLKTLTFLGILINLVSCASLNQTSDRRLQEIINSDNTVFVDVRTPEEFEEGSLENATNIPVDSLESQLGFFQKNEGENFIVFCRSGKRATNAKKILRKNKIKNVHVGTNVERIKSLKNE